MPEPMASEPAEPTTRQEPRTRDAVLARVIEEANEQVDDDWTTADTLAFREYFGERLATRLADLGLLADPAQTTELETRRTQLDDVHSALDGLDSDLGDDAPLGARVSELHESFLDMTRCHSEEGERTQRLTIERGVLSLLLRGMARKLVAYRKWMSGDDVPVVHRLRREAEERRARIEAVEAVLNEYAGYSFPDGNGPTSLYARLGAALVGDQPTEADFAPFADESREIADQALPAAVEAFHLVEFEGDHLPLADRARMWREGQALSGVALRDVEEADDASEGSQ